MKNKSIIFIICLILCSFTLVSCESANLEIDKKHVVGQEEIRKYESHGVTDENNISNPQFSSTDTKTGECITENKMSTSLEKRDRENDNENSYSTSEGKNVSVLDGTSQEAVTDEPSTENNSTAINVNQSSEKNDSTTIDINQSSEKNDSTTMDINQSSEKSNTTAIDIVQSSKKNELTETESSIEEKTYDTVETTEILENDTITETTEVHIHNWIKCISYIDHPEEGEYQNIMIEEGWTEYVPVYENVERAICNGCGTDITDDLDGHMKPALLAGNAACGAYHGESVPIQTGTEKVEHAPIYEKQWIIIKEAWTEEVVSYECECGEIK